MTSELPSSEPGSSPFDPPLDEASARKSLAEFQRAGEQARGLARLDEARDSFTEMRRLARRFALVDEEDLACLHLARIARAGERPATARAWAREAAERRGRRTSACGAAWAWLEAELRLTEHRLGPAREAITQAQSLLESTGERSLPHLDLLVATCSGRIAARAGDHEEAITIARRGLALAAATSAAGQRPPAAELRALNQVGAESAAALHRWDQVRSFLAAAATQMDGAAGEAALAEVGWDGVAIATCTTDLVILGAGGIQDRWHVRGGAERLAGLAPQVHAALRDDGPVRGLMAEVAELLAPVLPALERSESPLVVATHQFLSGLPWDLLPVGRRPLGRVRPVLLAHHLGSLQARSSITHDERLLLVDTSVAPNELLWGLSRAHPRASPHPIDWGVVPFPVGAAWSILVVSAAARHQRAWHPRADVTAPPFHGGGLGIVVLGADTGGRRPRSPVSVAWELLAAGLDAVILPSTPTPVGDGVAFASALARDLDAGSTPVEAWSAAREPQFHEATAVPGRDGWHLLVRDVLAAGSPLPPAR